MSMSTIPAPRVPYLRCQSTNDAYPSAAKIAVVLKHRPLVQEMKALIKAMRGKGSEFDHVVKMGRTQLQDAVPMTLGQEFNAMAATMLDDVEILERVIDQFYTLNLGGTAIGTGICADERFASTAIKHLSDITELPLKSPADFIESTGSTGWACIFYCLCAHAMRQCDVSYWYPCSIKASYRTCT